MSSCSSTVCRLRCFELKNAADENADFWQAYAQLQTYKREVPALFRYNELLVASDGLDSRIGVARAL